MTYPARRLLGPAVRKFFYENTPPQTTIGLAAVPSSNPKMPYGIVWPMPGSSTDGGWEDPDEQLIYLFQLTCVGLSHEQCAGLSDIAKEAWLGKAPGGGYLLPLELDGVEMIRRTVDSFGAIVPVGDNLFQSADQYRIEVQ